MPASIDDLIATVTSMSVQFTAVLTAINVQKSFIDNAATAASGSVGAAAASASAAAGSATTASNAAASASATASSVSGALTNAQTAANNALAALATISTSLTDAQAAAVSATASASSATSSKNAASASATTASTGATTATTQAGIATTQAGVATTKAAEAAASATTAAGTATALSSAAASATAAAAALATINTNLTASQTAATTATTKAGEAAASATTASTAATTSTTNATTATTKAGEAAASATTASTGASTATTKASDAAASAAAAAASAGQASAGQVNSDWNSTTTPSQILNKPVVLTGLGTGSILGRMSAGSGPVEGLSALTVKTLLSLTNVDNTADNAKPVSGPQATAIALAVSNLVASSPANLDTLNELSSALGNDANFATTMTTSLGNRLRVDTAAQALSGTQKTNAKTNLDLQNADNTSDANKPVSAAQLTALNLKANQATTYTKTETDAQIAANSSSFLTGDTLQTARALTAPSWLPCTGLTYLKSSYPTLASVLGDNSTISSILYINSAAGGNDSGRAQAYSPDGTLLAVGRVNGGLFIFSVAGNGALTLLSTPNATPIPGAINGLAWSSDSSMLAVAQSVQGASLVMFSRSGNVLTQITTPPGVTQASGLSVAFSPASNHFAFGGNNTIEVWSYVGTTFTKGNAVSGVVDGGVLQFTPNGSYLLASGSNSSAIAVFARSGNNLSLFNTTSINTATVAFDISNDGAYVIICLATGRFPDLYNLSNGVLSIAVSGYNPVASYGANNAKFSKDGKYIGFINTSGGATGTTFHGVYARPTPTTFTSAAAVAGDLKGFSLAFHPNSLFVSLKGSVASPTLGGDFLTYGPPYDINTLFATPAVATPTAAMGKLQTYIKT